MGQPMPMGLAELQRKAAMGDPDAAEQLKMLQGEQGSGQPPPLPPGQNYMGPAGGGVVPPGMPQGLPAGAPGQQIDPNMLQMFLQKLRGGGG